MPSVADILIILLCVSSIALWGRLYGRRVSIVESLRERESQRVVPRFVAFLAVGWILLQLATHILHVLRPAPVSQEFDAGAVEANLLSISIYQASQWVILLTALTAGFRVSPEEWGMHERRFPQQLKWGLAAVTAAWAPVFLVMLVTFPLRTVEAQHPLLRLLQEAPTPRNVVGVVLAAVILAPMVEELLYRVILQSWLMQHVSPVWAIAASSTIFGLVHGFPDSLAIVPLGAILGTTYYLRRSYWSIVLAHALFNAVNIALTALTTES